MADSASLYRQLLQRDRAIALSLLLGLCALAWWYLLRGAGMDMTAMDHAGMPMAWTPAYAGIIFIMWWVMMLAMMLPSALPMILLYGLISRRLAAQGRVAVPNSLFALGYLSTWGIFSLAATGLQWQLDRLTLLSPMLASRSLWLGGLLLVGAGVWQLTPLKQACLRHCRGPVDFLTRHWRPGPAGAWHMGLLHGLYCLGCCWVLMSLLFYGGIMNLYWIIGLSLYVMLEKFTPPRWPLSRHSGLLLIGWGAGVLSRAAGLI